MYVKFKFIIPEGKEKILYKNCENLRQAVKVKTQLEKLYGKENVKYTIIQHY